MRSGRFAFQAYDWKFRQPLATARGSMFGRRGWWVRWREPGVRGWGEIAPLPAFGTETEEAVASILPGLAGHPLRLSCADDPEGWESDLLAAEIPAEAMALRAGLLLALWDARARRQGVPLGACWSESVRSRVPLSVLVTSETPEQVARDAAQASAAGFSTLKLKIGSRPWPADLARLRAVRDRLGPHVKLRADANQAWSLQAARECLPMLVPLGLDLLEEPCRQLSLEEWRELSVLGVPLAADESLARADLAHALLAHRVVAAVILKPTLLGGPGAARAWAREAHAAGARGIVTSSLEGPIGLLGALHLASSLPQREEAHGLATIDLFASPPAPQGWQIREGCAELPVGPGLGIDAPWLA